MQKEKKNISMIQIADWFVFAFIIMTTISMFTKAAISGFTMLICAGICSPILSNKIIKGEKSKESFAFVIHLALFAVMFIVATALGTPKPSPAPVRQKITAEETTAEVTEQPTETPTETEPETIPDTTEKLSEAITEPETEESATEAILIELNSLQKLFASLDSEITINEIDNYITNNGLVKYAFSWNSGYNIGFEKRAVGQRERDRYGEAVDINFFTSGDIDLIGKVKSAKYEFHGEYTQYKLTFQDNLFYIETYDKKDSYDSGEEAMQNYLLLTKKATTQLETVSETETPAEPPTESKALVGKDIDTIETFHYNGNVRNDVTGNWRCAVFAKSGINVAEYAVSYYDKYMTGSDTEIHAVINLLDKKTTKIEQAFEPEKLALTVYEYVDGEEHDAKLMFGGSIVAYYTVDKTTGEIIEE